MRPIVIFFAFANDRVEGSLYLRNLPEEQRRVRAAMAAAEDAGLCEIVERANATAHEVLDVFQNSRYRDRVALFHFGGHAGGAELLLESAEGEATVAHAGGLARFLGQQRGLVLAFLNGCSTAGQAQGLLDAGVPAVIATSQAIEDAVATELAARFYQGLASGASLKTAFAEAQAAVHIRVGEREERWPWDLYVAPGAEERLAHWSLPAAAGDPLFGLPVVPETDLPPSPFKHLDWFTRQDAEVFFGRGREIRDLYEAVTAPGAAPIVLLFGATGAGKSSLLAAGLTPRLEASREVVYLRRDGALGLAGTLAEALGNDLGAAWRAREKATGKPLVVILDQAEEAWTRSLPGKKEEEDLAAALRSIFAVRETRPQGRLILGFRKEWLAEVLRLVDAEALPRTRVEVTHLDRDAIAEIVAGPASTERLRRYYRLEIEPALPEIVAKDLSEDSGSAVAPTLQILLSKMWMMASKESPPRFTLALYQRLKREGILLDDFLKEQLSGLREWRPDLVDSGLALDLLAHHTTPLGTAETRQAAEVAERYGGRPEVVELLERCKDRYLITGTARVQEGKLVGTTRLAHDTLAPLVRRRFEVSDQPGQRASRILQHRAVGWAKGKEGAPLDEVDLGIVEQGASGMPAWSADEQRLVEASRREREQRARRRRALRIGATVAAAAIAVSAGVAWWQRSVAIKSEQKEQDIARIAVAGEWLERDPTRAALLLLEVSQPDETAYSVIWLREAIETQLSEAVLRGHMGEVLGVSFSPDGRRVVTASKDKTARVWSVDGTGEPVVLRGHEGEVLGASFSPDGGRVVTASRDKTARVWSVDGTGEPVVLRGHEGEVLGASFSPDGKRIVTASEDNTARVWAADGSGEPVVLRSHEGGVERAIFSPDGNRVFTTSLTTVAVWSADGMGESMVLRSQLFLLSVELSSDGRRVVTASVDGTVQVWSADGVGEPVALRGHENTVRSASFSRDGKHVVTASWDKTARVWSTDGSSKPVILRGHKEAVLSAAFSPDGRRVVTASADGTAQVWSADGISEPVVLRGHEGSVVGAVFSPDGKRIVTSSDDKTARVWSADGSGEPVVLRGHNWQRIAVFSPDGGRVVAASDDSDDKTARVWPADGSGEPVVLRGHENSVRTVAFSRDGRRVVTASEDTTARVWSADGTGEPVILRGHKKGLSNAEFSPDGRHVVTSSADGTARVWSADGTGEPVILRGHEGLVRMAVFSLDGKRVVTASWDKTARVWSANGTGEPVVLRGHEDKVWSAAFNPDGSRLVTASFDKTARVWSADGTGEPLILRGHTEPLFMAAFSPDGRRIVTASVDGTARVWSADDASEPVVFRHEKSVESASFSPDGRRVVTASLDETARVWLADGTGEPVVLRGHTYLVNRAVFSHDGSSVVTASGDGTARVWAVSGSLLQALIRSATSACLDPDFRVAYLGEPKAEAQAIYDRCRRCVGPWRRQFDVRTIRAAPDKAWSKWQACMGW